MITSDCAERTPRSTPPGLQPLSSAREAYGRFDHVASPFREWFWVTGTSRSWWDFRLENWIKLSVTLTTYKLRFLVADVKCDGHKSRRVGVGRKFAGGFPLLLLNSLRSIWWEWGSTWFLINRRVLRIETCAERHLFYRRAPSGHKKGRTCLFPFFTMPPSVLNRLFAP